MPETEKGQTIKAAMKKQYGEEKGERVFYASKNKGTITGVDRASFRRRVTDAIHAGKPARDAIQQGLSVQQAANAAKGGDFFTQVRKAASDGLPAKDVLAFAFGDSLSQDYGVKGMQKGVRRASETSGTPKPPEGKHEKAGAGSFPGGSAELSAHLGHKRRTRGKSVLTQKEKRQRSDDPYTNFLTHYKAPRNLKDAVSKGSR